jgi:hypothetical protein
MKKATYFIAAGIMLLLMCLIEHAHAQWGLAGNAISTTNFLGSTNNTSLRLRTNNTQKMIIDSVGNVGIGILLPTSISNYTSLSINNAVNGGILDLMTNGVYKMRLVNTSSSASIETNTGIPLVFLTEGTEDMRIAANGNVGIGTTSPTMKLDVTGDAKFNTGNTTDCDLILQTTNTNMGWFASGSSSKIALYNYGTASTLATFLGDGNVGFGTTTPSSKLHIRSNGSTSTTNALSIQNSASTQLVMVKDNGNVGIGTASPSTKLHVTGKILSSGSSSALQINSGANQWTLSAPSPGTGFIFSNNLSGNIMTLSGTNVGIGTTTPAKKLTVAGTGSVMGFDNGGVIEAKNSAGIYEAFLWPRETNNGTYLNYGSGGFFIRNNLNDVIMTLNASGNLLIGTTSAATGYKVSIGGKLIAEEVRIALKANWPDYVFDKNYELTSIEEVENHIKRNKHLPGLPSASEVEQNGILIGEMQAKTIEKIEELTLYIIQLKKENNELLKRIEAIEKK